MVTGADRQGHPGRPAERAVATKTLPAMAVAPGAATGLDQLNGLVATTDLQPGEQVLTARFADPAALDRGRHTLRCPRACRKCRCSSTPSEPSAATSRPGNTVGCLLLRARRPSDPPGPPRRAGQPRPGRSRAGALRRRERPTTRRPRCRRSSVMVTLAVTAARPRRSSSPPRTAPSGCPTNPPTRSPPAPAHHRKERGPMTLAVVRTSSEELRPAATTADPGHGTARSRRSCRREVPGHRARRVPGPHPGLSARGRAHARPGRRAQARGPAPRGAAGQRPASRARPRRDASRGAGHPVPRGSAGGVLGGGRAAPPRPPAAGPRRKPTRTRHRTRPSVRAAA